MKSVGISAIALATASRSLNLEALAELRSVDPAKYTLGLGCAEMSLCGPDESAASMAIDAARDALKMWGGDTDKIGALIVGTETAADMSRPLSAWVAEGLGLKGAFRSYEVKHACYGGTAAVRQATEWIASGAARGKVALVIATDVALYEPGDPGEPTQGAGAVAMVISEDPLLAEIEIASYPFTSPVFDFWRPVGDAFPSVDGKFSLECYKEAAHACMSAWLAEEGGGAFDTLHGLNFHAPFPKMVKKAFFHAAEKLGIEPAQTFYKTRVEPHMAWNSRTGNSYTASAWFGLGHAMATLHEGARIGLFSYGSGAGAELMFLNLITPLGDHWARRVEEALDARAPMTASDYQAMRSA